MQNPAVNLLKPRSQEKPKRKKVKIHFLLWGIILAFFVLVGLFFDGGGWKHKQNLVSQTAIARFLPEDTQIFVWRDLSNNFFGFDEKLEKSLKILPEDLARDLRLKAKELAWARFGSAETARQILILKAADREEMANFLRDLASREALNLDNAAIYRAAATGGEKFYYWQDNDYFFFSASEQSLAGIANSNIQSGQGLESNPRFREAQSRLSSSSPLAAYFNLGDDYPMSLRLDKINSQGAGLEVYYNYQEGGGSPPENGDSYLKFLPPSPFLVLRIKDSSARYNQVFTTVFWRLFDPDGSIQKSLADFGEEGYHLFGGASDLELIGSLKSDGEPGATLILGGSEEDFQKSSVSLQNLAAFWASYEEETILPDGTEITEQMITAETKPEEIIIDGVAVKIIPLASGHYLFYGYLGGKLVISNAKEALEEVIASFHLPEIKDLARNFSGSQEWFYFDLEKVGNFDWFNLWPDLKKIQGSSRETGNGTLFKVWLEI
ncbi:MAG: hypothetical protein Q8N68_00835 [bacterium]|nr:hypothetical protein [bacterium]